MSRTDPSILRAKRKREERARATETYRRMIVKFDGGDGGLRPEHIDQLVDQLEAAGMTLGIPWESSREGERSIESDVAKLRRYRALEPHLAKRDELTKKVIAAREDDERYAAGWAAKLAAKAAEEQRRRELSDSLRLELDKLEKLVEERKALEAEMFDLLGVEDPAALARRRHLMILKPGEAPPKTPYEIFSYASVLAEPVEHADPENYEFIPAPGQSEAEMRDLLDFWREMRADHQPLIDRGGERLKGACLLSGGFLIEEGYPSGPVRNWTQVPLYLPVKDALELVRVIPSDDLPSPLRRDRHRFFLLPGQDPAWLEEQTTKLWTVAEKFEKARKAEFGRWQNHRGGFELPPRPLGAWADRQSRIAGLTA